MSATLLKVSTLRKIDLLGDEYLVEFINDTISFYMKNKRVAFLSKYSEVLQGAQNVVPIRELMVEMIKLCLRKTVLSSSIDLYKEQIVTLLQSEGFDLEAEPINQKTIDIIATSVFAKREEIQLTLTQTVLEQSSD